MYIYIFFSPTVQTGVCKIAQFMPWEPFHQPSHQHQAKPPLPGERKSSHWVKKGSGCPQPQECIQQPGIPSTADPLRSPSTPGDRGRLSCPTPRSSTSDSSARRGSATPSTGTGPRYPNKHLHYHHCKHTRTSLGTKVFYPGRKKT